jgi:hypothetical protein
MNFQRCCDVLDLTPPVMLADLKEAYKDLVQVWHPDRFVHNPRLRDRAEEKIKLINIAYETLEQFLLEQQARQSPPTPRHPAQKTESSAWNVAAAYHDSFTRHTQRGRWGKWFDDLSLENKARVYAVLIFPITFMVLVSLCLIVLLLTVYPWIGLIVSGSIGFYVLMRMVSDLDAR